MGWSGRQTDERTNRLTDHITDGWSGRQTDEITNRLTDTHTEKERMDSKILEIGWVNRQRIDG